MSLPPFRGGALWPTIFYVAGATLNQGSLVFGSWELGATTDAPGSSIKMAYPSTSAGTNYNATDALQFGIYTFAHAFSTTHDDPIVRMGFNADGTQNGYANASWNTCSMVFEGYYWVDGTHIYAENYSEALRLVGGTVGRRPFGSTVNIVDGSCSFSALGQFQVTKSDSGNTTATFEEYGASSAIRFYRDTAISTGRLALGTQTLAYTHLLQIDASAASGNVFTTFYDEGSGHMSGIGVVRNSANYWAIQTNTYTNILDVANVASSGTGNAYLCGMKFNEVSPWQINIGAQYIVLDVFGTTGGLPSGVALGKGPPSGDWKGGNMVVFIPECGAVPSAGTTGAFLYVKSSDHKLYARTAAGEVLLAA